MKREDLNKKVLAIVDGSNVFSRKGCKFVTKREGGIIMCPECGRRINLYT